MTIVTSNSFDLSLVGFVNNGNFFRLLRLMIAPWMYHAIFMWFAGDWWWRDGWIFCGLLIITCYVIGIYMYLKDPALLKERYKQSSEDQDPMDKILLKIVVTLFLVWFIVLPLDAKRYKYSATLLQFNETFYAFKWLNFILMIFGMMVVIKSFVDCTFLSPMLRIQHERKHKLIDTGSFAVIRHPMYSGFSIWYISSSLFVGSFYGLLTAFCAIGALIFRINIEEAMLENNLDGYYVYKKKVRYKLIPFVF